MNGSKRNVLLGLSVLTLAFIWGNSLLPGTVSGAVSDWVGQVLARLFGGVSLPETGHGTLRKLAHGTEYMVLGVELWGLLRHMCGRHWSLVGLSGVLAAMVDETIQLFVPGRCGAVADVWIDLGGFTVGCLLCGGVMAWRVRKRNA